MPLEGPREEGCSLGLKRQPIVIGFALPAPAWSELKDSHHLSQFCNLSLQAAGRSRHLLHQGRIVLGHLVHLHHRLADLADFASMRFVFGKALKGSSPRCLYGVD